MAYESNLQCLSFKAGEDLSSAQYHFVKISADDTVVLCDGATDSPIGILQNAPENGQTALVAYAGVTKVEVGTEISAGDAIGTDASGTAEGKTIGTDTTNYVTGICVNGAAADEVASALINILPNRAS